MEIVFRYRYLFVLLIVDLVFSWSLLTYCVALVTSGFLVVPVLQSMRSPPGNLFSHLPGLLLLLSGFCPMVTKSAIVTKIV